ncbi:MAG: ArsR/SmtB family transcription factor, partial [Thermoplasmata archaeon]
MQGDALELAQLLTDEYAAKILIATFRKPMSALELAERFGIPVAQCYRRIHALERAGLLKVESRVLTREGKRIYLYKSLVRNVQIYYEGTKVKVKVALREAAHSEIEKATELISLKGPTHLQ